ncbi:dTDP-4-dehydrorhamnose 3,5-epimerase [Streptomyces sp. NBC_00280]|uniref:dTDP-4-dehydrorhamnose 3,5-epimerase n=1 Tax=Streptomyces sp. NBC_00280 TaxID=2975699 RepID=UPI003256831B
MKQLAVPGAWLFAPTHQSDERGTFHEAFRGAEFASRMGHPLRLAQANVSVSRRGVLRGIHYADVPPGQAKYVSCLRGAVLDVAVDLRLGSPAYGTWEAVELSETNGHSLYLEEGLGHAFLALTDDATVMYLCSEGYTPAREHGIDPFDPDLGIDWPRHLGFVLSGKDADAPGLAQAAESGLLPSYERCREYGRELHARG